MRSLQGRLVAGLVFTLVVLFTLQWAVTAVSLRTLTEHYVGSRLEHDIESLLAVVEFTPEGVPVVDEDDIDTVFRRPFSGHYFHLATTAGALKSHSLLDHDFPVPPVVAGETRLARAAGPERQPLLLLAGGYIKRGRFLSVAVAEDYSPIENDLRDFLWRYVVIAVLSLAALVAVQMVVVRGSLRPLGHLREELARLERGEVERVAGEAPEEVRPLVEEINRLIQVMQRRLEQSRHALGNLAHALKTPLTVLTQAVDGLELREQPALRAEIEQQTQVMRRLVERELKRARLAGAATPGRRFDVNQEIPPLVDTLRRMYREKGLMIACSLPPLLSVPGEREDMLELFGNLLDNACKWARHEVLLTVREGPALCFTVEDDGPGAPAGRMESLVRRGVRVDESVDGYGLGLSIVREIVESYGGTLELGHAERLGGFRAEVSLPFSGKGGASSRACS